jgi:lysophospholipase L1-like esterase
LKAAGLFLLLNLLFAWFQPLEKLGALSLYNTILPGRARLPYGENPATSYSLSFNNIPAMLASHEITQGGTEEEFRILVIGDSGSWGWLLEVDETLAGQLNAMDLSTADGRPVVAYNLAYPIMALAKDLLLLDEAMCVDAVTCLEPDLVLWPVTLQSFPRDQQLQPPLVQENPDRMRALIAEHGLALDAGDGRFVDPTFWERTIVGQRRALADLLRLQLYGFSWAATGIDQTYPDEIRFRSSDLEPDLSWGDIEEPVALDETLLALDVLQAGLARAGDVPVLIINEPIFISDGENSDLRYNAWYPRWAYDDYRELLGATAAADSWAYLDLWDAIEPDEFTDSPVHLTPAGTRRLAEIVAPVLLERALDKP